MAFGGIPLSLNSHDQVLTSAAGAVDRPIGEYRIKLFANVSLLLPEGLQLSNMDQF